jgi:RND family efflux transporter MFP subunit
VALSAAGCTSEHSHADGEHDQGEESWSVTAWGEHYEVFPEVDLLAAGETAVSHTHVTILDGFAPLVEGTVAIILRDAGGGEQDFRSEGASRPGIFPVEIRPQGTGDFDLLFRIDSPAGSEDVPGGRVRVGTHDAPGGLLQAPMPEAPGGGGEPLTFLKEEQWRSELATAWVETGTLQRSADGLARVRPAAGGEAAITAPMDAVLRSEPWPYPGKRVRAGEPIFRFVPRIAADRSLAALAADVVTLETELAAALARRRRLAELLPLEATSERELEEAAARIESLTARHRAALRDLEASRSARQGGSEGSALLTAPFAGEIASVRASPGEAVSAGALLARLVHTDPLWLEVAVSPEGARQVGRARPTGVVASFPEGPPLRLEDGVRLVAIAPEVSPATGTVTVLLEVPAHDALILGTTVGAQILLGETTEGIVVPASAVIDDGGVPVVYLQLSGESFARREVHVIARQGDRVLVEHLTPGERLVTRGGEAIRRSSLMATGEAQGHVH